MGRIIGGVIVGYIVMFVVVFATFSVAYMALGAGGAFKTGTYDVSGTWIALMFGLGLVAAVAGGWVCSAIAKSPKGKYGLVIVVLVMGILSAIPAFMAEDLELKRLRPPNVDNFEAMQNARQPIWVALLNPIVGVVGVCLGARLHGGSNA